MTTSAATPPDRSVAPRRWTPGRVVTLVLGSVAAVVALGLLVGGLFLLVTDRSARDSDGFLSLPVTTVASSGSAVSAGPVDIEGAGARAGLPERILGEVRVRATSAGTRSPIFVGIAPSGEVSGYLAGVAHTVIGGAGGGGTDVPGTDAAAPPASTDVWVADASGTGEQELRWAPTAGRWSLVVMNADGSPGVDATVEVAATVPWLTGLAVGLLVAGVLGLLVAAVLVAVPLVLASRRVTAA